MLVMFFIWSGILVDVDRNYAGHLREPAVVVAGDDALFGSAAHREPPAPLGFPLSSAGCLLGISRL